VYTAMIAGLALCVLGLVAWYVRSTRRRLKVTSVLVPDMDMAAPPAPLRGPEPAVVEGVATLPSDARGELMRSLERMEGDLAALRAEVERMREQVRKAPRQ